MGGQTGVDAVDDFLIARAANWPESAFEFRLGHEFWQVAKIW